MSIATVIIVARGGSKRIPRKNVRLLCGKPLIAYSIECAQQAKSVDEIIVSTDDDEIAGVARKLDCVVQPRPNELATDTVRTLDTLQYCVTELEKDGRLRDYVVLLQPTVPFRPFDSIDRALKILRETGCDAVNSYIRVDYFHPNRMKRIENGRVQPYCEPEIEDVPRTDLPEAYYRDGSIYAVARATLMEKNSMYGQDLRSMIHPSEAFVNIDTERDWMTAEQLLAHGKWHAQK